jgi:hypothetical protein
MNQQFGPSPCTISIWAFPAIIAITFHEAAHRFVAGCFGDDDDAPPPGGDRFSIEQSGGPVTSR